MSYEGPHVCNKASAYRPTLCSRTVSDGERYCHQHRPRTAPVPSSWSVEMIFGEETVIPGHATIYATSRERANEIANEERAALSDHEAKHTTVTVYANYTDKGRAL